VKDDVDHVVLARSMSMPSFRGLRQLAQEAHRLRREAAPDLADEHEHVVPALERRLVLGGVRHAVAARRHHVLRRELAEVFLQQPRARRAEGLGRTTKQLGCVRNDGVVDLDLSYYMPGARSCM
jgi:hypothetical protein